MITLPPIAAGKAAALVQAADDAAALWHATTAGLRRAISDDEATKLRSLQQQRNDRQISQRQLVVQVNEWLARLPPHVTLEDGPPISPPLENGETITAPIERVRQRLGELQGQLMTLKAAPPSLDELKANVRSQVQELARQGCPIILVERNRCDVTFPRTSQAFAAWLFEDVLLSKLEAAVSTLANGGVSQADRQRLEATLSDEILALEHQEEALIEVAKVQGQDVIRRPNANPLAILNVRLSKREANAA